MNGLTIDVVSDVVCAWCFIGKRHLDRALQLWRQERSDSEVAVRWRPFFLNPDTPQAGEPYRRPFLEQAFCLQRPLHAGRRGCSKDAWGFSRGLGD